MKMTRRVQFEISRKNCCPSEMGFVYGLVAPGRFVNVPVTLGADCKPNAALGQLWTTLLARRWIFKVGADGFYATYLLVTKSEFLSFAVALLRVG